MGDKVGVFVPPFTDTQAKGVVEFPGDGFGVAIGDVCGKGPAAAALTAATANLRW